MYKKVIRMINMQTLKIHESKRYIVTQSGNRYYLIGDTAWELFHKLSREKAEMYLKTRKKQGFNMIQAVILAEFDGLNVPNYYGRLPLKLNNQQNYDPILPDTDGSYSYFDHVEYVISLAESLEMYIGLLPTWGDKWNIKWGIGPEIFTVENAYIYGKWIAERYRHHNNLIWILGGDRPLTEEKHFAINNSMALGIKDGDSEKFLMTLHPCGMRSSSEFVHEYNWLDFNMMQSGHSNPAPNCFDMMAADYIKEPIKPVMNGEPCYEDHTHNQNPKNGYYDDYDIRLVAYRNLFGGACGHTYGHSAVWQFKTEPDVRCPNTWEIALNRPGAMQISIYNDFIRENNLIGYVPIYNITEPNNHDATYIAGMVSEKSAYLYLPAGAPLKLNLSSLSFEPTKCRTFEPKTGKYSSDTAILSKDGTIIFSNRPGGRNMDIVVIIE